MIEKCPFKTVNVPLPASIKSQLPQAQRFPPLINVKPASIKSPVQVQQFPSIINVKPPSAEDPDSILEKCKEADAKAEVLKTQNEIIQELGAAPKNVFITAVIPIYVQTDGPSPSQIGQNGAYGELTSNRPFQVFGGGLFGGGFNEVQIKQNFIFVWDPRWGTFVPEAQPIIPTNGNHNMLAAICPPVSASSPTWALLTVVGQNYASTNWAVLVKPS
jgi:hypothetical protein